MASIMAGLMWLSPDVAARWLRLLTMRALIWRILIMFCSSRSRVMRLPLPTSARMRLHAVRLSASMNRHIRVDFSGSSLAAPMAMTAPSSTLNARIRPLSSHSVPLSPISIHMVSPANIGI